MKLRKKAVESMMGEPIVKIVMKSKAEREMDEPNDGMISMKVTPEEKEMILAHRAEKEEGSSDEEEGQNPFVKKAETDDA